MTTEPTLVLLRHLPDVLRAAIVRLMQKPKAHRPFVVVDDAATGKVFVQFAGSDGEPLIFDVPRYNVQCPFTAEDDLRHPVQFAIDLLYCMGLEEDTLVRVFEEAGTGAGKEN